MLASALIRLQNTCTDTSRPCPNYVAHGPFHSAPIRPFLIHVLPLPKTRHPSHPPLTAPFTHYHVPPFTIWLRLARTDTQHIQRGDGLRLLCAYW